MIIIQYKKLQQYNVGCLTKGCEGWEGGLPNPPAKCCARAREQRQCISICCYSNVIAEPQNHRSIHNKEHLFLFLGLC